VDLRRLRGLVPARTPGRRTWADWGVDYLKYDYCSYGNLLPGATFKFKLDRNLGKINWMDPIPGSTLDDIIRPYREMGAHLATVNRDIVFSICNGGPGDVWKWGAKVAGTSGAPPSTSRTTGRASPGSGSSSRRSRSTPAPATGTTRHAGGGPGRLGHPRKTRLTRAEQVTHITIWAMQAAPLIIGCDMTALDQFTIDLLTNDDVLDVDQDPNGIAAKVVVKRRLRNLVPPLFDGTMAWPCSTRAKRA